MHEGYGWSGPDGHLGEFYEFEEHGQKWCECKACGAQWSIHEHDYEEVSEGDGYCADHYGR